eukprot:COSAG02_NODE_10829_length_1849_cov_14.262286_2_plen_105_part_00
MWGRSGTCVGCIVVLWSVLLGLATAEEASMQAGSSSRRQLPETGNTATMSGQHSLLLKVKSRLHDPLDSLASWVPEVGPCDDGADSVLDGWKFVKCDGSTVTQL